MVETIVCHVPEPLPSHQDQHRDRVVARKSVIPTVLHQTTTEMSKKKNISNFFAKKSQFPHFQER